jgi:D-inositol-3-phosphate glycosyltransferase
MTIRTQGVEIYAEEKEVVDFGIPALKPQSEINVAILTGGIDRHYAFGLATGLISKSVCVEVVGSDALDSPEMHGTPGLNFLNLRGNQCENAPLLRKVSRVLNYYARLIGYAWNAKPKIFHILWNNRFKCFDRTLLMVYYKIRGKKVVRTAHNVNGARRENRDSAYNRLTLRIQYRLADHIFVHTPKMKDELVKDYGVSESAVTIIPYGINNAVPITNLTSAEARRQLGISEDEKTILFFGNIRPYKGLEHLVTAFEEIIRKDEQYHLIIAGWRLKGFDKYWEKVEPAIRRLVDRGRITLKAEFIPDEEVETYFKAADVLALPYNEIFQSGVLFLGYSFGVPAIATDVGSLREDIIEGRTGFLCKPRDVGDLARTIERYFDSDLFKNLKSRRKEIRDYVNVRHSWGSVATITRRVYSGLMGENSVENL